MGFIFSEKREEKNKKSLQIENCKLQNTKLGSKNNLNFSFFILKWEVTMDRKKLEETILKKAKEGKLPCAMCFKIAEDFKISKREMGKILNEMKVRISQCQLGCFE